jgi:hypothetical protein
VAKPKYIFVNQTFPKEWNPGCYHTTNGLLSLLSQQLDKLSSIHQGELAEAPALLGHPKAPNTYLLLRFLLRHPRRFLQICRSSYVVINGEGTIHDNAPSAVSLIWITFVATLLRKKVILLNSTIERMNERYIRLLSRCTCIVCREPGSMNALLASHIKALHFPDASLCSPELISYCKNVLNSNIGLAAAPSRRNHIAVTFGVLSESSNQSNSYQSILAAIHEAVHESIEVSYISVHHGDGPWALRASALGWNIVDTTDISDQTSLLRAIDASVLVITGRYHIALFACLLGRHVILLPSNTSKMQQLFSVIRSIIPDYPITYYNPDSLGAASIGNRISTAISDSQENRVTRQQRMLSYAESATSGYRDLFASILKHQL